MKISTTLTEMQ